MKKFIRTIRSLSERAAELQEAIQQVPPKVAEIREAVTMTTGQLQQLQADVQRNVMDLKADGQDRLVEALHEVNGSTEVFHEAGYTLGQVEMELSPVSRLMVHLSRIDDVHDSILRSLATANKDRKITHALLTAVMQAEAMADQVDINNQVYYKLIVHIGPVPAVRLCWMPEVAEPAVVTPTAAPITTQASSSPESASSAYSESSFFKKRTAEVPESQPVAPVAAASTEASPAPTAAAAASTVGTGPSPSGGKGWGAASLERFKKMPSASKYQRRYTG